VRQSMEESCPLRALFSGPLGYTHTAFRQAVLLYEAATTEQEYNALCQDIASAVTMYSEFISLLQFVARQDHIRAVVVSCGLRRVWEAVLEKAGLASSVKVIAGGRISDGYVVTGAVKADLVAHAREHHKLYVWAFGDSVLDLGMLKNADRAVVITGDERTRSKTMDGPLEDAIDNGGLRAHQVLLPGHVWPRLTTTKLPLIDLTNKDFTANILGLHTRRSSIELVHATDRSAAKLLMTRMRDATVFGPSLREVHGRVGQYLATEFLSQVIGVEEYPIPHVQGHTSSGCRLLHERQTLIVALMRGGEPMAFGVNEVFPHAMFLHANSPGDVLHCHVKEKLTVILVDSVVNSGKTIVEFVRHIRNLHATIRIVVVAGVVQAQCMSEGLKPLDQDRQLSLVALRLSDNKFTGKGTTDTGNRLFNTTHLA
jgi:uracil phosphoribosyltransferase/phosphoserine phosphatase